MTRGVPQSKQHQDVGANGTEWRVADQINYAVHWWQRRIVTSDRDFIDEGRVDVQLALLLITYAWRQGLAPTDFDNDDGKPALRALAEAIATDKTLRFTLKSDVSWALYGGQSTLLIGTWQAVIKASTYLLEKQPRRYEVDK